MLAAVDLSAEYWNLAKLVIALLQPLLVLALIAGLVVATAHLLTMIGTRWGDRRASSKAMFFSIVIHLLLAMGLVTLIPEYRSNLFSKLAELESDPIRIFSVNAETTVGGESDTPGSDGPGKTSALFQSMPRLPDVVTPEIVRTELPSMPLIPVQPLDKPTESMPLEPQLSPDREHLPEPAPPLPQQEIPVVRTELEQARTKMKLEQLPVQRRPEVAAPAMTLERSHPVPAMTGTKPDAPSPIRPEPGPAMQPSPAYSPDRQALDLADISSPDAELTRAHNEMSLARPVTVPAAATPQIPVAAPRNNATPGVSDQNTSAASLMTRTDSRTTIPTADMGSIERARPRVAPEPAVFPAESTQPGPGALSDVLPVPTERPQLSRTSDPFTRSGSQERVPSAYRLRTEEEREKALIRFGGSQASEAAVDRSLKWMASVQNPAGYWDASEYEAGKVQFDENGIDRRHAGREADVGVTALAVLAFLGKLNTVDQGEYSPQVNRALRWIVSQQTTKHWGEGWGSTPGYLGGNATDFEAMYCHAMATFALGEAYAMSRENPNAQWLRAPLELAIHFILDVQNVDGGWRYIKGQREGDMSIFGWQVMALKSAEAAGIFVDTQRKDRMRKFLVERQLGNSGGLAGYRSKEAASAAMTAEALYCRQMLGIADNTQANQEAIQMMLANVPHRTTLNFYYWYYGTLAMHQHGGPEWEKWNSNVRDLLISEQRVSGPLAGSWDPRDIWGGYGGRMYSTAIATLSLEVYYRYLPLYRVNETDPR